MTTICLITNKDDIHLWDDDVLLYHDLLASGIKTTVQVWDEINLNQPSADVFIIRSVWDYHLRHKEFLFWLDNVEKSGITIHNTVQAVKYNIDKSYLLSLQKKGINIVPTLHVNKQDIYDIDRYYDFFNSNEIIIKPVIGASSYQIQKMRKGNHFNCYNLTNQFHTDYVLIQKYMPEVVKYGEVSIVFINKKFSHAVVKKAKHGDFRVQDDFGGTFKYITPDSKLISKAEEVISLLDFDVLYARVDCLYVNDHFHLMEIELIEPILYLHDKEIRQRFIGMISQLTS